MCGFVPTLRLTGLTALLALMLSACVPGQPMVSDKPEDAAMKAPVEDAETAYLSRADGPHLVPAIPLEKFPEGLRRQQVAYQTDMAPGSIVIHPGQKFLYFVTGKNKAIRYGISVGKSGFEWAGEAVVSQSKPWPTWTPPPEMIERSPKLAKWEDGQPGGPTNPLGARAIYLLSNGRDYGYRIHGTPEWWSIGRNASSGCIRLVQQDIIDLNARVRPGAQVLVLNADGSVPKQLKVPPPPKKKTKPKPAVVAAPAVATTEDAALLPTSATAPATESTSPASGIETTAPLLATPTLPATGAEIETVPTTGTDLVAPQANAQVPVAPSTPAPSVEAKPAVTSPSCVPGTPNCPVKAP